MDCQNLLWTKASIPAHNFLVRSCSYCHRHPIPTGAIDSRTGLRTTLNQVHDTEGLVKLMIEMNDKLVTGEEAVESMTANIGLLAEGENESRNLLDVTIEEIDESTNLLEVTFE
jgi:hypothetical protein